MSQEQAQEVCRCLRSKEMFVHDEPGWTIRDSSSGIFWCMYTQTCIGPDGQIAGPDHCVAGRSCHETL
jgi:hypothetical protein